MNACKVFFQPSTRTWFRHELFSIERFPRAVVALVAFRHRSRAVDLVAVKPSWTVAAILIIYGACPVTDGTQGAVFAHDRTNRAELAGWTDNALFPIAG